MKQAKLVVDEFYRTHPEFKRKARYSKKQVQIFVSWVEENSYLLLGGWDGKSDPANPLELKPAEDWERKFKIMLYVANLQNENIQATFEKNQLIFQFLYAHLYDEHDVLPEKHHPLYTNFLERRQPEVFTFNLDKLVFKENDNIPKSI